MGSVAAFVRLLDVEEVAPGRFTGGSDAGERRVVDGSQVLAQSIVAAATSQPGRSVRSARSAFMRTIAADVPLDFEVIVVRAGRRLAFVDVVCRQGDRECVRTSVVLDHPGPDVIRHAADAPASDGPDAATVCVMPMEGREIRLDGIAEVNSPDEVGPPTIRAWLRYDDPPERDDLAKALLAHFTGHLSISTTMRAHAGIGTADSHATVSTAPLVISVVFHEPVSWTGWLLYDHESTYVGAGTSYVRSQIFAESGRLVASFTQEAMLRRLDDDELAIAEAARL